MDWHRDETKDYIYNEVAVDYNAGFVGACAGLYKYYGKKAGDKPLENFPPSEESMKGEIVEYTVKAAVGQEDARSTQVLIEVDNHAFLPPRYLGAFDIRYYFDISELLEAGLKLSDLELRADYDSIKSATNGEYFVDAQMVQYDDKGDCFVNLHFPDYKFYGKEQFQFALVNPTLTEDFKQIWDPTNDYSRKLIRTADEIGVELNIAPELTDGLTMYAENKQVWGEAPKGAPAPEGTAAEPTPLETKPAATKPLETKPAANGVAYGDVNLDKTVSILDVISLNKYLLGSVELTKEQQANADVDNSGKIDGTDSLNVLKAALEMITLPVKAS
ncbi:MAG: hypothetical protein IJ906_16870 [Oscillospiraceae bacterium]|nr:hypothetical protein [Oscillospiraceae bacterium]